MGFEIIQHVLPWMQFSDTNHFVSHFRDLVSLYLFVLNETSFHSSKLAAGWDHFGQFNPTWFIALGFDCAPFESLRLPFNDPSTGGQLIQVVSCLL
jgi:hypothetical protein